MRAEAHLIYEAGCSSPLAAKFAWKSGGEVRTASHVYETAPAQADNSWSFDAGTEPATLWVEYSAE